MLTRQTTLAAFLSIFLAALTLPATAQASIATAASTAGTIPMALPCQSKLIVLPDIVISENYAGAIRARAWIAIGADYRAFTAFDIGTATLKAYRIDNGADVSAAILAGNTLNTDASPSAANIADVSFQLVAPSGQDSGPIKLVISGLKGTLGVPEPGDIALRIGGADGNGQALDSLAKIDGNLGAGVSSQDLRVAIAISATNATVARYPSICDDQNAQKQIAQGPLTSQTITLPPITPAGRDLGQPGSFFVLAVSFGKVYFMDSQMRWSPFDDCATAPAYSTGPLERTASLPIVTTPSDLSNLMGTQLVTGYGLAADASPAGRACIDMLQNARYNAIYTLR
jgi:hypothetical protein